MLGIAPEIVTVAIRTSEALSVPEIDVAGEMFRIKARFISFITSVFRFSSRVENHFNQSDGPFHLVVIDRSVGYVRPFAHIFCHHSQFDLHYGHEMIPAPVLIQGCRHAIKFNCRDQFMVMSFAQFTDRSGLRDIETTLNLCRSGIKVMSKSTLAEANEKKDWRIYQDFAMALVKEATALYKDEKLRIGLEEMIYAFDSSTI